MDVIILAGGLGTRLKHVIRDIPKPMAPVHDTPFLEYILNHLSQYRINNIILSVGYRHEVIQNYFGNAFRGIPITYSIEETPLGTGGGIMKAMRLVSDKPVLVLNGDTYYEVSLDKMKAFHEEKQAGITLALKPMQAFDRYGTVETDDNGKITGFHEKMYCREGLINGGAYLLDPNLLLNKTFPDKFSFEKDYLEKYLNTENFYGFIDSGYFIDIGIPEDYERAKKDFS